MAATALNLNPSKETGDMECPAIESWITASQPMHWFVGSISPSVRTAERSEQQRALDVQFDSYQLVIISVLQNEVGGASK